MNAYFVMAKMDEGDAAFDGAFVDEKYPGSKWLPRRRRFTTFANAFLRWKPT